MRARWLLACILSLPLLAPTRHAFTFEDMMKLKRVEEPVVAPDGKWVLFAVVDVDLDAEVEDPAFSLAAPVYLGKAGSSSHSLLGMTSG